MPIETEPAVITAGVGGAIAAWFSYLKVKLKFQYNTAYQLLQYKCENLTRDLENERKRCDEQIAEIKHKLGG